MDPLNTRGLILVDPQNRFVLTSRMAIDDFERQRVLHGVGMRRRVADELGRLDAGRALVLTTPGRSGLGGELSGILGPAAAGVYSRAAMHTPVDVTEDALGLVSGLGVDSVVAAGGGSTIGLAKAIALRTGLPQIAIPTTYAGSEATPILGQTEGGRKTTIRDMGVLPDVVLYDPELVATLPPGMTATSGLNAMAHAAEALYAEDRTGRTDELALEGLRAFAEGLPAVIRTPGDLGARGATQRGAWACGTVLGRVGMALHHKLCHTLGGMFNLHHARTHAVVLPHAVAYNEEAVPELLAPIAAMLGNMRAGGALWELARSLDAPMTLAELGMERGDIPRAVEAAMEKPYWNPREITQEGVSALLESAFSGARPGG